MNDEILAQFSYNPKTGHLSKGNKIFSAVDSSNGYIYAHAQYKKYSVHRIAFRLMTGRWPAIVDHINRNKTDNRWCNLREASASENSWNRSIPKTNKSKVAGVCWDKNNKRWKVSMSRKHLGVYTDWFEAVCKRKSAESRSKLIF